jgi:hypothetical protein
MPRGWQPGGKHWTKETQTLPSKGILEANTTLLKKPHTHTQRSTSNLMSPIKCATSDLKFALLKSMSLKNLYEVPTQQAWHSGSCTVGTATTFKAPSMHARMLRTLLPVYLETARENSCLSSLFWKSCWGGSGTVGGWARPKLRSV